MKRTLSLALSLLLLCGCTGPTAWSGHSADSPAPTQSPMPEGALPRDQALEESRNLELKDQGVVSFVPGLEVECPDMVYQGQVMQMADFSDKYSDTILHWWVPDEAWNDTYLTPQEEQLNLYPLGPTYEEEDVWYADVWCTGSAVYERGKGRPEKGESESYSCVATYDVLIPGASITDSYPLKDGSMTIEQAVQMGNDFAAEWCSLTPNYPMELRVITVNVYDREDGTYFFDLCYESSFEGAPVNCYPYTSPYGYVYYAYTFGTIDSVDGFCEWGGGSGAVVPYDMTTCTEILPLEKAVERMMRSLPDNSNYEVQRISLEYRFQDKGSAQTPDQYRIPNANGTMVPDNSGTLEGYSYQLYQLQPFWVFYINGKYGTEMTCYYNCLTGECKVLQTPGYAM